VACSSIAKSERGEDMQHLEERIYHLADVLDIGISPMQQQC
jgi:hypothetical protein